MLAGPHPRSRSLGGRPAGRLHSVASLGPQALSESGMDGADCHPGSEG